MAKSYTKAQIRNITRRFGLIPLKSSLVSSLYRKNAVIQVKTKKGTYALKPFSRTKMVRSNTLQQMKQAASMINLLKKRKYRYMPTWLPTHSGKLWTLHQGTPFYVSQWIKGRGLETAEDFEKLGWALATLHTKSIGLHRIGRVKSPTLQQLRVWKNQDRLFQRKIKQISRHDTKYRNWYNAFGKDCKRLSRRAWKDLQDTSIIKLLQKENRSPSLIHSDITIPNVIISDGGQLKIIDWDRVKVGSVYADLAKALMNTTQFNPEFVKSFLKGYQKRKPLSRTERKIVTALYKLPREAWHASLHPNRSRDREILDHWHQSWPLRLQIIHVLQEWVQA
ncbi:aminoglycoside phosphotransferase family protein [Paenibacillus brasilensis]|uniref:Ser/Thr protein kinase RdoA (MazF antagonist) n=1 Tax=Paenibacillus brasilensis TaxID=128574 RepID=A0ABU0KY80_9BACL|nr:aminoglycoside phosphotransferase family protein [Paenibacillus brasilensis]MDQ0494402.1 Ser/Thr protein kinase RdoA (MazF antagonist) [Paenibacillus brasilensis]